MAKEPTDVASSTVNQTVKYLEGLTIHKVPYNIANTLDFKTNVMGKAADNELFIITDTPTFSLKIGNVTYDGTSNVSATTATQSVSGLMSAADKKKLDGIAEGATKITIDTALSSSSTNPVQNKVINSALGKKLDKSGGTLTGAITTKGIKLTSGTDFGSSLPSSPQSNQLFFQTLGSNYILDNVYPVGSIYMSVNSTNPTNLFGGTWEQIQGKFLFGMNSSYPAGSTGGEITHKLTNAEMPTHAHYMASGNAGAPDTWTPDAGLYLVDSVTNNQHTWWAQIGMNEAGGNEAHNNMPPYLSVYIWKRTK